MKKMTDAEKLKKCVDFLESIEKSDPDCYNIDEVNSDSDDVYIRKTEFDDLKERIWHLLAEISD